MAEFYEMMKEWHRMCRYQEKKTNGCGMCMECPLNNIETDDGTHRFDIDKKKDCCTLWPDDCSVNDIPKIEKVIMKWSEEHPETPTLSWFEWLVKLGIIREDDSTSDFILNLREPVPDYIDICFKIYEGESTEAEDDE